MITKERNEDTAYVTPATPFLDVICLCCDDITRVRVHEASRSITQMKQVGE